MAGARPAVCNRGILEKRRGRVYNGHVQKKKEDERMEKRITPDELAERAVGLLNDPGALAHMAQCQRENVFPDAAERICRAVMEDAAQ